MKMTSGMFLNYKTATATLATSPHYTRVRFRCFAEVSLRFIGLECVIASRLARTLLLLEVLTHFGRKLLHLLEYTLEEVAFSFGAGDSLCGRKEEGFRVFVL